MYYEHDAIYRIKIPENYTPAPDWCSREALINYWDGRLIRFIGERGDTLEGVFVNENGNRLRQDRKECNDKVHVPPSWIDSLYRHCPQVERYIASQKQEEYISPFDGKTK